MEGEAYKRGVKELGAVISALQVSPPTSYDVANKNLSKAKILLLKLDGLTVHPESDPHLMVMAREVYEQGALYSIRAKNADGFTRYVRQLAPYYELPASVLPLNVEQRNKIIGLHLLLLLTQGLYAEFHAELESLSVREGGGGSVDVEGDRYLGYPIRLERWLMEGSYDQVWKAMSTGQVPCEEYAVFSGVRKSPFPVSLLGVNHSKLTSPVFRSSSLKSATKSHPHPSAHTPPFLSAAPNPSSSSTPRAPSLTLSATAAGRSGMARSGSQPLHRRARRTQKARRKSAR